MSSTQGLNLVSKTIKSKDGTEIFAEAAGDSSKQAIVFVHGFASAGVAWDTLFAVPDMQKHLYLVRYDLRGHGRSGKPETDEAYESAKHADDFDAVCSCFGVKNPFYAGWSYGGSFAADVLAAHKPSPIKGLIWLGALPYIGDVLPLVATPLTLGFLPGFMEPESPASGLETRIEFCRTLVAPSALAAVPFTVLSTWIGLASLIPPGSAKALCSRSHDPSRLKEEAANGLPLCTISGKDDLQVNGQAVIDNMKPLFKDFESHLLDGVGHFSFYENPEEVARIILKFVSRVK